MRESGIEKEPGSSTIEVDNQIHEFLVGDIAHPRKEAIYQRLQELNRILRFEENEPDIIAGLLNIYDW